MRNTGQQLSLFSESNRVPGNDPGISVRQSARAKRLSIKVFPRGRVEVVVPHRTSARVVTAFVAENQDWIRKARASFSVDFAPESYSLPSRIHLAAIDQWVIVVYQPDPAITGVRFKHAHNILTLRGDTSSEEACVGALKRWLSGVARKAFEPQLKALSLLTETPFKKMHVRLQRTCWGSRSSSGTISLNMSLLFLAPELLRYLMVHELCHGRHMNHSKRFWRMVGQFEPRYRSLDKRLGEGWRDVPDWLGVY